MQEDPRLIQVDSSLMQAAFSLKIIASCKGQKALKNLPKTSDLEPKNSCVLQVAFSL